MGKADRRREYLPGDRVRRKSDGKKMTVVEVYSPPYHYRIKCSWGDDEQSDLFRPDEIELDPTE
jgi:uncharacterized protein YodC (DUF2158 family)